MYSYKSEAMISIVIVSYNTRNLLRACLHSIPVAAQGLSYEVFVVDNGSRDGTVDMLQQEFADVRVIANRSNVGFAAANNQALVLARGTSFLLLNPDTEMQVGSLRTLHDWLADHPAVGAVGPRLLNRDGSLQRSAYHFPTPGRLLLEQLSASKFLRRLPGMQRVYLGAWVPDRPRRVDWLVGACLLLRREALVSSGLLDPDFFMYGEEIDLLKRLASYGWQTWLVPSARVVHYGGASSAQVGIQAGLQSTRGMYQFYRKHYGLRALVAAQMVFRGVALLKLVRDSARLISQLIRNAPTESTRGALALWWKTLLLNPRSKENQSSDNAQASGKPNGSLKRLDWRFLLPSPESGRFSRLMLAASPSQEPETLLQLAHNAGLAEQVMHWAPGERACCVAVLAGSGLSPSQAASVVGPGGVLYFETDRRRSLRLTPERVAAELESLGLVVIGKYWAKPNFDSCELWLPLDRKGALLYYVNQLFMALSPAQMVLRTTLRILVNLLGEHFSWLVPCHSVVAVRQGAHLSTTGVVAMFDSVASKGFAREARPLLVTMGPDTHSRVVGLAFTPYDRTPRFVAKAARWIKPGDRMQREFQVLRELQSRLSPELRRTVPRPLAYVRGTLARSPVLIESAAHGRTYAASCSRWEIPLRSKIGDLEAATSWLIEFQRATQTGRIDWDAAAARRYLEEPVTAYTVCFGATPAEEAFWDQVRMCSARSYGRALPLVWQHRDFHAWNIFRSSAHVAVIDWEGAEQGLPLTDLSYFGLWWYLTVSKRDEESSKIAGFAKLFTTTANNEVAVSAVKGQWKYYMDAMDVDPGLAPVLHTLTWVGHALDYAARQQASGVQLSESRAGNIYCRYIEQLAQQRASFLRAV
jgi:N-acetylglucosaminyl-diphospho-decaprenol L-rhamnosyltransferase